MANKLSHPQCKTNIKYRSNAVIIANSPLLTRICRPGRCGCAA